MELVDQCRPLMRIGEAICPLRGRLCSSGAEALRSPHTQTLVFCLSHCSPNFLFLPDLANPVGPSLFSSTIENNHKILKSVSNPYATVKIKSSCSQAEPLVLEPRR